MKQTIFDIIVRILVSPFIICITFIFSIFRWLQWLFYWALYGGELINYHKKQEKVFMMSITNLKINLIQTNYKLQKHSEL